MGKSKPCTLNRHKPTMEKRLAIGNRQATDLEKEIAKVIFDLAQSSSENKDEFKNIYIAGAREFSINSIGKREKRVVLIYVPYPSLKSAQKLHYKIVLAIQKKKSVQAFITAKRTILSRWHKVHHSQKRPRSRTLTSVFDSILDDLLVPGNITARRIRHKLNGKLVYKIWVNEENRPYLEERADAISQIYESLTHRKIDVGFKNDPKFFKLKTFSRQSKA